MKYFFFVLFVLGFALYATAADGPKGRAETLSTKGASGDVRCSPVNETASNRSHLLVAPEKQDSNYVVSVTAIEARYVQSLEQESYPPGDVIHFFEDVKNISKETFTISHSGDTCDFVLVPKSRGTKLDSVAFKAQPSDPSIDAITAIMGQGDRKVVYSVNFRGFQLLCALEPRLYGLPKNCKISDTPAQAADLIPAKKVGEKSGIILKEPPQADRFYGGGAQ